MPHLKHNQFYNIERLIRPDRCTGCPRVITNLRFPIVNDTVSFARVVSSQLQKCWIHNLRLKLDSSNSHLQPTIDSRETTRENCRLGIVANPVVCVRTQRNVGPTKKPVWRPWSERILQPDAIGYAITAITRSAQYVWANMENVIWMKHSIIHIIKPCKSEY